MAKAKKQTTTKVRSNSSFWSKLAPNTGKKKLILFIVVFALVGGGVMAYRGNAASDTFSVTADASNMVPYGTARVITENASNSKKSKKVIVVPMGTNTNQRAGAAQFSTGDKTWTAFRSFLGRNAGKETRLCAFMRPGTVAATASMIGPADTNYHDVFVSTGPSSSYQYLCTPYKRLPQTIGSIVIPEVGIRYESTQKSLYVWGMVLEVK